mmetsp:Transcript_21703/g.51652  ORF Transcript_21703/g.51652 Transcript_21703/m.51652 type:complete len:130 (-) Transcript_21703:1483-1872(-)
MNENNNSEPFFIIYSHTGKAGGGSLTKFQDMRDNRIIFSSINTNFSMFSKRSFQLNTLGPGDCIGESVLMGVPRRTASAAAVTEVKALEIDLRTIHEVFPSSAASFLGFIQPCLPPQTHLHPKCRAIHR